MTKTAQLIIVVLVLVIAAIIGVYILPTENKVKNLEATKLTLEDQVTQSDALSKKLVQEKTALENQLKDAQAAKAKIQKDYDDLDSQVAGLNSKVTELTNEHDTLNARLEETKKQRDELTAKLEDKEKQLAQGGGSGSTANNTPAVTQADIDAAAHVSVPESTQNEAYWASVLKEKASLELQLKDIKAKMTENSMAVEDLKKKNSDLDVEIGALKNEKIELERKLSQSEDISNAISVELARGKNTAKSTDTRLEDLLKENNGLRDQIKSLTTAKMNLEKSIIRLNDDKLTLQKKLDESENVMRNKVDQIWELKKSVDERFQSYNQKSPSEVELAPIVVSANGPIGVDQSVNPPGGDSGMQGHVVSVNDDNNFVIVDLGEQSGIKVGDNLNVFRNSKYVAGLEVIQVRQEIAAADIKQKSDNILIGDNVR